MNWTAILHNGSVRDGIGAPAGQQPWHKGAQNYLISAFERVGDWQERIVQRRRLMTMDERMLHDIGLCRTDAINEAAKPFWKA
jgi:uncharacterized protein YjiS (DUF1127 family)